MPRALFVAETLGCTLEQMAALGGVGFDYFYNSSKWWDFTAPWCLEQHERFRRVAPSISFPESHDTPRLAAETGGSEAVQRQRYAFAAFFSAGVQMPIGYEWGFERPLDVVKTRPEDWEPARFDLCGYIGAVNRLKAAHPLLGGEGVLRRLDWGQPDVTVLRRWSDDSGTHRGAVARQPRPVGPARGPRGPPRAARRLPAPPARTGRLAGRRPSGGRRGPAGARRGRAPGHGPMSAGEGDARGAVPREAAPRPPAAEPRIPRATYRIQFNRHFTFSDATRIVPYLDALGVGDLYASPYLAAQPGSLHGYDIVDHNALNPEIGSAETHAEMSAALRARGMGQVLDVVPNHMSIAAGANRWWNDVLENGPGSQYAEFFDIDWEPVERHLTSKVLLPILGDRYGRVLENGELVLELAAGAFCIRYHDAVLPVEPRSTIQILTHGLDALAQSSGDGVAHLHEYQSIITALGNLPTVGETAPERVEERAREKEVIRRRLCDLVDTSEAVRAALERTVAAFNGRRGEPASFDLLDNLLVRAAVPARPLARGGRGDQLPALLRRERARGDPRREPRRASGRRIGSCSSSSRPGR